MGMIRPGCMRIQRLAQDFVLTDRSTLAKIVIIKSLDLGYSSSGSRVKGVKVVQGRCNQDKSITKLYCLTSDFYVH